MKKILKQFGEPMTKEQMKLVTGGQVAPCAVVFYVNCGGTEYTQGCGSGYPDDSCGFTPIWADAMAAAGCVVSPSPVYCA